MYYRFAINRFSSFTHNYPAFIRHHDGIGIQSHLDFAGRAISVWNRKPSKAPLHLRLP